MWDDDQEFERGWWGDCTNTYAEETKQLTYAHRMGLTHDADAAIARGRWPVYDLAGKSILDIGGGPVSMLLKTTNGGDRVVVDPCAYPDWVIDRYLAVGVMYLSIAGEDLAAAMGWLDDGPPRVGFHRPFDEVWIYNCLQHTKDPALIAENAWTFASTVRVFEWIDMQPHLGHPHMLTAHGLTDWFGPGGTVEQMNENGCHGRAWYGVFSR